MPLSLAISRILSSDSSVLEKTAREKKLVCRELLLRVFHKHLEPFGFVFRPFSDGLKIFDGNQSIIDKTKSHLEFPEFYSFVSSLSSSLGSSLSHSFFSIFAMEKRIRANEGISSNIKRKGKRSRQQFSNLFKKKK